MLENCKDLQNIEKTYKSRTGTNQGLNPRLPRSAGNPLKADTKQVNNADEGRTATY